MKKMILACLAFVCCISLLIFAGCGDKGNNTDNTAGNTDKVYSYSFDTKGGTEIAGGELFANDYIPAPADPVKSGHRFTGWYFDESCTRYCTFVSTRMPAHDTVIYAGWQELVVISFDSDGGSEVLPIEGLYQDEITDEQRKASVPEKDDNVFDGWFADENREIPYSLNIIPAKSIKLYAKWHLAKNVTVNFTDDNNTYNSVSGTEGESVALPKPDVIPEYMRFIGWADGNGKLVSELNGNELNAYVLPGANVTLKAVYRQKQNYAHIIINASKYNDAKDIYVKRGEALPAEIQNGLVDETLMAGDNLVYNGFLTTTDFEFKPHEGDKVGGDMVLNINAYTEGLEFDGIYTHVNNGGTYFGKSAVAKYYGKDNYDDLNVTQKSLFSEVYKMVSAFNPQNGSDIENVVIPRFYESKIVAMIGNGAFMGAMFTTISLPDTIQVISKNAFKGNVNLKSIVLPESLTEIGDSAFAGCTNLADVQLNDELYVVGYKIFENTAFMNKLIAENQNKAIYLKDINPNLRYDVLYAYNGIFGTPAIITVSRNGVKCIAGGAFEGQTNIIKAIISDDVFYIGTAAFKDCTSLESVSLGTAVQYISDEAFMNCEKLAEVDQTENEMLMQVGAKAFYECRSLKSFDFCERFTTLGESSFYNCTSLKSANMYSRVEIITSMTSIIKRYYTTHITKIPKNAFYGCSSLERMELMDYVQEVETGAFEGCTSLIYVALGYTDNCVLSKLHTGSFKDCTSLTKLIVSRLTNDVNECIEFESGCFDGASEKLKIYISSAYITTYQASDRVAAYKDKLNTWDLVEPVLTFKKSEIVLESPTYNYDVRSALFDLIDECSDDRATTEEQQEALKNTFRITSVRYDSKTLTVNKNGNYDLLESGTYVATARIEDEFGRGGFATIQIVVKANII